jgi:magnesium-transporting ATPase (P-type)
MTFAGIVACQVGTAFASRTSWASLRSIGIFTNHLLLRGITIELAFTAVLIYAPPFQAIFGTAPLGAEELALLLPFPFVIWGTDELRRYAHREHGHTNGRVHPQVGQRGQASSAKQPFLAAEKDQ